MCCVDFYRVAFVLCPPEVRAAVRSLDARTRPEAARIISRYTSTLNTTLYRTGEVCFDEHTLGDLGDRVGTGRGTKFTIMAACPGNPLQDRRDLEASAHR